MDKFKLVNEDKYSFYKLKITTKHNVKGQRQRQWDSLRRLVQMNEMSIERCFDDLHKDATLRKSVDDFIKKAYGQINDKEEQNQSIALTSDENLRSENNIPPDEKNNMNNLSQIQNNIKELQHEDMISDTENGIHSRKSNEKNDSFKNSNILKKNSRRTQPKTKEERQHSCVSKNESWPAIRQSTKGYEINEKLEKAVKKTQTKNKTSAHAINLVSKTPDDKKKTQLKTTQIIINSKKDESYDKSHQNSSLPPPSKELSTGKITSIFQEGNVSTGKVNAHCQQTLLPEILISTKNNPNTPIMNGKAAPSLRKIFPSHTVNHIGAGDGKHGYDIDRINRAAFINGREIENLGAPLIYYNPALTAQMNRQERVDDVPNSYISYSMDEHPSTSLTHLNPQGFLEWETNLCTNASNFRLPSEHFIPPYDENTPFWDLTWIPAWNEQSTFSINQTKTNEANKTFHQDEPSRMYYGPAETILHGKPGIIRHTGFNVQPASFTQVHSLRN